jgi:hypothetical protein
LIRIALTRAAYAAIEATLESGLSVIPPQRAANGGYLIHVKETALGPARRGAGRRGLQRRYPAARRMTRLPAAVFS